MSLSTRHLVLGLVVERPTYGYALEGQLEDRFGFLDMASSAVYGILGRLERDGLIAARGGQSIKSRAARNREIYEATPEGVEAFREWMAAPSARPMVRDELQAKISFATPDDLADLREIAKTQLSVCVAKLEAQPKPSLAVAQSAGTSWPEVAKILANDYAVHMLEGTIDWLVSTIEVFNVRIEATRIEPGELRS